MTFTSCGCNIPAEISTISPVVCGESFGQIQKIIFQRRQQAPSFATQDNTAGGAAVLASWNALKTASDSTKIQATPFFEGFVIPSATAITEGGDDNTTLDGNPIVVGTSSVLCTGMFRSLPSAILGQLKSYSCEADLSVYFINEFGKIIGNSPSGTDFTGISITEFFIGDPGNEGKNTHDKAPFQFNMRYGWRDNIAFVTPDDFDARTAI